MLIFLQRFTFYLLIFKSFTCLISLLTPIFCGRFYVIITNEFVLFQELTDAKHQLEATVRDMELKQSSLEADVDRLQTDLATIRHDYTSLGSDRSEQEREIAHVRMKLAVMEQDLKMKDEQLMRVAEEISFERDAKV